MVEPALRAGAARVDITPPLGTVVNGDLLPHYARWVHDPLFAKALVLDAGSVTLALVVVDTCAMPRDFLDDVKRQIQQRTGIPPAHVLVASTHTHAAGSVMSLLGSPADLPYRQSLPAKLVAAVETAHQARRPAKLAFGAVEAPEHVVCRRFFVKPGYTSVNPVTGAAEPVKTNPFGAEAFLAGRASVPDPQVGFLAVRGVDDRWISVLANYGLHYVGDWPNGTISADYFGVFSEQLREMLGADDDFVGMMSNGTSGEINIWDFLNPDRYPAEPFAKSALIGGALAGKVAAALPGLAWQEAPRLEARYAEVPVGVRKPTADELASARAVVAETAYEALGLDSPDLLPRLYAREQVLLAEYPDVVSFPVQALRVGDGAIGALGGEFFAETGLALKAAFAPAPYFTVTMANGYVGYVPPAHELDRGGYETWRCRSSFLEAGAEARLRGALLTLNA